MKRIIWAILVILALALSANAEEKVVWQIGEFDNNYEEFAIAHDHSAYWSHFGKDKNRTFRIGKDEPADSWPFIQPGPADAWVRHRQMPFTVLFDLLEQPTGTFTLTIDLVDTHAGSPPVYEVTINKRGGRFSLPAGAGDLSLTDASKGKEYTLNIPIPAEFFNAGENKLVLGSVQGSWLIYDALRLTNDREGEIPKPQVNRLTLTPTIRFVRQGSKLKQVAHLSAEFSPGTSACTATVKVGETTQDITLESNLMGTTEKEIYLDEITQPTTAEVVVTVGDQTKTASCELLPQRHWKIYVQPSTHVDVGYTDFQERVIDLHNDNMSLALELCKDYPDFKWNTEAAWVQDNYLSMMPDDRKAEFVKWAAEGRIGCQAIYGNMLTGICSHESLIRDLYYAHEMSKKYGIPYDIAMSSDVPTQVWTLPTVLAGAGIKYFSAGLNLTRGNSFNRLFDKSPFYWQGPDGSKVLAWLSPGYAYAANLGLNSDIQQAETRVGSYLKSFDRENYPYDAVLAFGGFGDNRLLEASLAKTVHEWNENYAYPKIILCRGPEFFEYIEANFRDRIPTIAGDGGVYWEDGAGSSALETALVRRAKEDLAAAEKLHALTSIFGGSAYPKADLDLAWKNAMLYDEHTWGAHCSISQPESEQTVHQWEYKARFAKEAARLANDVLQKGMDNLAETMAITEPSVVVFNPLSWPVSGLVQTETPDGRPLEFWADDVPPLGYETYPLSAVSHGSAAVRQGGAKADGQPPAASGNALSLEGEGWGEGESGKPQLENRFYRLEFDAHTGAVTSVYDKELGIELVDAGAPYGINQYIYIAGQAKDAKDATRDANTPKVTVTSERTPHRSAVCIRGSAYKTPEWTTRLVLYDNIKRIDFVNTLNREATYDKEAGYFAFPFGLNEPEFYVEIPDGVMRPKKDMLDGACMQWYCAQDFVAAADDKCAVVWTAVDSPLITIGDINRETFQSPIPIENGHLYAYAFNNYWFTNYKASQGGPHTFRFAMTSARTISDLEAKKFGESVQSPLVCQVVDGRPGAAAPYSRSFVEVSGDGVVVQAMKPARFADGTIIRLREMGGRAATVDLTVRGIDFEKAYLCNLAEDIVQSLEVDGGAMRVPCDAFGLATVLLAVAE